MKPTWRSNDLLGRTRNKEQEHFEALPRPLHIQYSRARQSQEHADTRSLRGQRRSLEKVRVRNTRRSRKTGGLLSLAPAARLGLAGGEKGAARVVVLAGIDELPLPRSRRVTSASSPAMTAAIWVAAAERSEVIVYAKVYGGEGGGAPHFGERITRAALKGDRFSFAAVRKKRDKRASRSLGLGRYWWNIGHVGSRTGGRRAEGDSG